MNEFYEVTLAATVFWYLRLIVPVMLEILLVWAVALDEHDRHNNPL